MAAPAATETPPPEEKVLEPFPPMRTLIQAGDTVVMSGGDMKKMVTVKRNAMTRFQKLQGDIGSLIGMPFGCIVELDEKAKKFHQCASNPDFDRSEIAADANDQLKKDNRGLDDNHGEAQALAADEIVKLRDEQGAAALVNKLVESSATFESKTAFAQDKYVRKKKAKYTVRFKVERVTVDNLCDIRTPTANPDTQIINDDARKPLAMRIDTVAQILHYGNIKHNSRVMIYDDTNGVMPAALLNRMDHSGKLYQVLKRKQHPQMSHARAMMLPGIKERWCCVPYEPLLDPWPANHKKEAGDETEEGQEGDANPATATPEPEEDLDKEECERRARSQWLGGAKANELFKAKPVDTLIVCAFEPEEIVMSLLPFLSLSGSIVAYCNCSNPLYNVFPKLRFQTVGIRIADTWYREYQVLPGRTHPTVTMSGTGGFLLSAIKVQLTGYLEFARSMMKDKDGEEGDGEDENGDESDAPENIAEDPRLTKKLRTEK